MSKLLLSALAGAAVLLGGCGRKDDGPPELNIEQLEDLAGLNHQAEAEQIVPKREPAGPEPDAAHAASDR